MKVIVCTGDSHTSGQGGDSILTGAKPKEPNMVYNTAGKGMKQNDDLDMAGYVNVLRQYVAEYTGSEYAISDSKAIRAQTGYPRIDNAVKLEGELLLPKGWEMHVMCLVERSVPAKLGIYEDDVLVRTEELYTQTPRYNDRSYRSILVPCSLQGQVKLVPLEGEVYISHIQHNKGAYTVVNSGIGSCTTDRYLNECFEYAVEEFKPDIVVAEAQTINDWLNYDDVNKHGDMLNKLIDRCIALNAKVVYSTVVPICGHRDSKKFGLLYEDFTEQARQVGQRTDILFADSNAAYLQEVEGMTEEEIFGKLHVDNWHVNGEGHKIYADTIFEKLKELL